MSGRHFDPGDLMDEPVVRAARLNDDRAETLGVRGAVERAGLDFDKITYLSEQRAMRVVLSMVGRLPEGSRPVPVSLDPVERATAMMFQTSILDGILIGWVARGMVEESLDHE